MKVYIVTLSELYTSEEIEGVFFDKESALEKTIEILNSRDKTYWQFEPVIHKDGWHVLNNQYCFVKEYEVH